jgi:outer membrane protein assembly factor BamB
MQNAALWTWKRTPDVPTPVILDDLVYLCMENGNLTVLEAMTGKEVYSEATHRQRHRASPVVADGKLYLTARDGRITVVQTGREFKVLAVNELGEDQSSHHRPFPTERSICEPSSISGRSNSQANP